MAQQEMPLPAGRQTQQLVDTYANHLNVSMSAFDFTLDFALVSPSINELDVPQLLARIRISPQLAKQSHALLGRLIEAYEGTVGTIPAEPGTDEEPDEQ
jgi:uncharacterized protein DUF3467